MLLGVFIEERVKKPEVGDWRTAAPVPEAPPPDAHAAPQDLDPRDGPTPACRSGMRTPKTGVWEGRLPALRPPARMFAQAPHRFLLKQAGEPMGALGLPPQDDAQVVWKWLRGR